MPPLSRIWLVPVMLLTASCATSQYSVTPYRYSGVRLYQVFCASCHGLTGHGDGPVAPLVKARVPDLTTISARNGGSFPAEEMYRIIDGRSGTSTHGPRRMPVWGFEFYGNDINDRMARQQATETVTRLVDYLRTLQPDYYD